MAAEPILFVDLDGTLIEQDSFWFSVKKLMIHAPWFTFCAFLQVGKGRAWVKDRIAGCWVPSVAELRLNPQVMQFIDAEKRKGRTIILATAANYRIAERVVQEVALFDRWIASDAALNLSGVRKLASIRAQCAGQAFDYIGDSIADIPILRAARNGYVAVKDSGQLLPFKDSALYTVKTP